MATVSLKNVMKIYPHSGDEKKKKKAKKGDAPEKKSNLQITDRGVVAVQQFNLDIADQEFIVLVGPSGCGKSTTLRMVAGLEEISEGQLLIDGKVMNDVAPKDRDIAMVFQSYALYPHMTVYENMAFSLKLKKVPKDEIDRKVKEAAEILDITQYLDRKPKALSGGQRQRLTIARALVRRPQILILDDSASALDFATDAKLRRSLRELDYDPTVFIVSQRTSSVQSADSILVLDDGVLAGQGTHDELLKTCSVYQEIYASQFRSSEGDREKGDSTL